MLTNHTRMVFTEPLTHWIPRLGVDTHQRPLHNVRVQQRPAHLFVPLSVSHVSCYFAPATLQDIFFSPVDNWQQMRCTVHQDTESFGAIGFLEGTTSCVISFVVSHVVFTALQELYWVFPHQLE